MLGELGDLAAVALLAPVWHMAGRATQRLQLPAITGIMLAGLASGPQAVGLLSSGGMASLAPLVRSCLSLIALAAGAELHLPELRRLRKQVACLTLGISLCSWVLVYCCMRMLAYSIPFVAALEPDNVAAVCTLAATLAVARSPASAIAVLKETEGKGPYCSLVMSVVVVKDVLLFAAFAVNIELARAVEQSAGSGLQLMLLLQPLGSIARSVLLGGGAGYCLSKLLRMRQSIISIAGSSTAHTAGGGSGLGGGGTSGGGISISGGISGAWQRGVLTRLLRHPKLVRLRPAAPLLVSSLTFAAAEMLGGEPLLACVAVGLVAANWRHTEQQGKDAAVMLSADLTRLMPIINPLFFGLVGASLKLAALWRTLWAAAILYLVRLAGVWTGCWVGTAVGGTPPDIGRRLWMGMVTQAGIALGLAQEVAERFPDWGPDFAALMAGVVVMNLLTGPPLFKAAVLTAGESRALVLPIMQTELQRRLSMNKVKNEAGSNSGGQLGLLPGGGGSGDGGSSGGGGSGGGPLPTIPIISTTRAEALLASH